MGLAAKAIWVKAETFGRTLECIFAFYGAVLLAADVSVLLAWELMAVVSFLLVNHEAEKVSICIGVVSTVMTISEQRQS